MSEEVNLNLSDIPGLENIVEQVINEYGSTSLRKQNRSSLSEALYSVVDLAFRFENENGKASYFVVQSGGIDNSKLGLLENLTTVNKNTAVEAINEVNGIAKSAKSLSDSLKTLIGSLSSLTTEVKTSLVNAINELDKDIANINSSISNINGKVKDASTTVKGIVQLSSVTNSTAENLAATAKAVKTVCDLANNAISTANTIKTSIGTLTSLTTSEKRSIVGAINEIDKDISSLNGKIRDASLTAKGLVQLSSATNSTAENLAATPKAVKSAYDLANKALSAANDANIAKYNKTGRFTAQQTFSLPIKSEVAPTTFVDAAKGQAMLVSNAADDKFVPYLDYNSSTGSYLFYGYNNSINIGYMIDANVTGNKNTLTHVICLLNKDGLSTLKHLTTSGTLTSNGNTVTKSIDCNGNIDISGTSVLHGKLTASGGVAFSGTCTVPTPSSSDNSTKIATTAFVNSYLLNKGGTVVKKGERTTKGNWSISNLIINKPLFIVLDIKNTDWGFAGFHIGDIKSTIGGVWPNTSISEGAFHLGDVTNVFGNSSDVFVTIPQQTSITIYIPNTISANARLTAFQ